MSSQAQNHSHHNHSVKGLAPIGVMGDHVHNEGGVMFSYRYMKMKMNKLSNNLSVDDYFSESSYMMAPEEMETEMHMFGGMYAFTNTVSLSIMSSFVNKEMIMIKKMGRSEVKSTSSGLTDIKINTLVKIAEDDNHRFIAKAGFVLPTGSITQEDNNTELAYGMQLGSGSYGVDLGLTYSYFLNTWSLGSQVGVLSYLNENSNDYTKGNEYLINLWISKAFTDKFNASIRFNQLSIDPLKSNEKTSMLMSSSFDPKGQHGSRNSIFLGFDYSFSGAMMGNRVSIEFSKPLGDDLSGQQLESESMTTIGWQKSI
jgi:hypothetical protein